MSESKGWAGKGLLGCGALLLLLCTASCLFWGFHVFIDPRGAISDDEALPGMLGAIVCGFISAGLAAVGLFLTMRKPSGASAAAGQGAASQPGATSQPGVPAAPPKPKGPFPTHFVAGCLSLLMVLFSCVAFGGSAYFFDRVSSAEMFEEFAIEDQRMGRGYGLGPGYWRRKAEERRMYALGSLACGGVFLLLFFGGVGGAVVLFRKNKAKAAELAQQAQAQAPGQAPPPGQGPAPGHTPPPGGPPGSSPGGGGFTPPPPSS